jgi:hypothetical protein
MRANWIVAAVGMMSITGCATSNGLGARDTVGVTMPQGMDREGVRAGEARVVDAHINPRVPIQLSAEGDSIAVRFAHPRAAGAILHLNSQSLMPLSSEESVPAERPTSPPTGAVRVTLDGGRFIVCWRRGDTESGYRLMAQAWTASGSPLGQPVPISPPETDVLAAPQLVATHGERAVATFAASTGDRFELFAVSLEVL